MSSDREQRSRSQQVREGLDHPIIDSDGHTFEFPPLFLDYLKAVAGEEVARRFYTAYSEVAFADARWNRRSIEERRERSLRPTWWGIPARNTADLATAMFPRMLRKKSFVAIRMHLAIVGSGSRHHWRAYHIAVDSRRWT